ncbi:MAG: hypothetical protein H7061_01685 [Bdellovibrionaceae bacterium]|nr:hypothetical protein [Bdellovibrio sp.]
MKNLLLPALLLFTVAISGCIPKSEKKTEVSYSLEENGCSTETHTFSSQDAMCDGLRDDALNKHCAQSLRYDKFKNECPNRTW